MSAEEAPKPQPEPVETLNFLSAAKKARYKNGLTKNGGVVNLNGTQHTKALHCPNQITGNLQGILHEFNEVFYAKMLINISLLTCFYQKLSGNLK